MAETSRVRTELLIPNSNNKYFDDQNTSSAHRRSDQIWIEPRSKIRATPTRKVAVLYYLSRNGHLEHPHLIEVPLSSSQGLYLRDVMNCLNYHRGNGLANMYSWSFKRSYKSGYVWQDVTEDDLVHPTNGHDYVLKGSELLLQTSQALTKSHKSHHSPHNPPETNTHNDEEDCSNSTSIIRRRNQSWSSFDNPQEYVVYKCESNRELAAKFAADAATQTEEKRRRSVRRERSEPVSVELSREEMSPPPSNSSSEGVSGCGSRDVDQEKDVRDRTVEDGHTSGRMKASQVLMQFITCGTVNVKDFGVVRSKEDEGCLVSVEYGKRLGSEAPNQ